jgi:hypothetical protein
VIELLSNRAPWIAATAGERLLFLLLNINEPWHAGPTVISRTSLQQRSTESGGAPAPE